MFRRMIQWSFTVHRFILIRPIIIQAMCLGWGWHLARDSYWEQRGQTIGATAIGATATSPLTTTTISIETTSPISIGASKAENGSTMLNIAEARLTATGARPISMAAELANSPLAQLVIDPVVAVAASPVVIDLAAVVVTSEEVIDPAVVELEQWIVPAVVLVTGPVAVAAVRPIVQVEVAPAPNRPRVRAGEAVAIASVVTARR